MSKTFYIASAWGNIEEVQSLAGSLQLAGWYWHEGWDWTSHTGGVDFDYPPPHPEGSLAALKDIHYARDAELFVLLLGPKMKTVGAWCEFGARIGNGKIAHVITNGYEGHLFLYHPLSIRHEGTMSLFKEVFA